MLTRLEVRNFTVFREATFDFSKQLNVIHGANGTGKTHLLKLAYAVQRGMYPGPEIAKYLPVAADLERPLADELVQVFRPDLLGHLTSRPGSQASTMVVASFHVVFQRLAFSFQSRSRKQVQVQKLPSYWLQRPPIYLPTREVLSIYPGFVSLYETYATEFDRTWRDLCGLLGAPVLRGKEAEGIRGLLASIEEVIGGHVELSDSGRFYLLTSGRQKTEMHLVAEGVRKLAMVARLASAGHLRPPGADNEKTSFIWDEPEANLNPVLIKKVARVLLMLARQGIQVFLGTHSLFLLRELHILGKTEFKDIEPRFFGLHVQDGVVSVAQGPSIEDSGDLTALDEELHQAELYMDVETGVIK